ncbi:processed acidic surface protein [Geobacillus sp. E263]|uniref:processed acidic surface protein n=1 Tax=Geobacillus sp. E263 TaxID=391290 RepID=UPI00117B5027|nr:processed acidic surface protein [Geobacillus sp. E263]
MKKLIPFAVAAFLAIATLPASAFAIESNDPELQSYLNEIGMTQEELKEYLDYDGYTLEDFQDVDELGDVLTEENLQQLLEDYGLTKEELKQLLIDKTVAGEFTYKVRKVRIVDADDRTVIVPKPKAILTVSTCYPFGYIGAAPKRYILVANLVEARN